MSKHTARQIAELAQVSLATVSRVMNGTAQVSLQLKTRVMEAAAKLGYVPADRPANSHKLIGLLAPKLSNPFYSEIIEGVLDTAATAGYGVVLCPAISDNLRENGAVPFLNEYGRDLAGLISLCRLQENSWLSRVFPEDMPIVQCCEYDDDLPYPFVAIDNYAAAYHATTHLLSMGHTKLCIFNSTCHTLYGRERERGFIDALKANDIPLRKDWVLHLGEVDYNLALAATKNVFSQEDHPDAVFCVSDVYAAGIIKGVSQLGMRVPEDISVIGFDDTEIAMINEPPLTTVHQPRYKLGSTACNVLLRLIRTGSSPSQHFWVESDLVLRNSTRARTLIK